MGLGGAEKTSRTLALGISAAGAAAGQTDGQAVQAAAAAQPPRNRRRLRMENSAFGMSSMILVFD
jgi:hypothetical protein